MTDEGTGFGLRLLCAEGILPPGTAQDEHFVLIVAHPTPSGPSGHLPLTGGVGPGPHYGGYPLGQAEKFRRAKSEWPLRFLPGHWALALREIGAGAVSQPRLALPNQRYRFRNTGYLIRPLRGHLPLKGKAKERVFKAFPFRGRWLAVRPDG